MARKTLLTEAEVRNFMKLAELKPLSDAKIDEMYGKPPGARDDEEDREEEDPAGESLEEKDMDMGAPEDDMDDAAMDMGDAADDMDDAAMDMDDAAMDMGDDMDMGAELGGDSKMVAIDDFMSALENALEDVLGEPVSTEMDDDMGADMDDDMGADDDMDMDMTDDIGMDMDADDEEEPGMRDYMAEGDEDELVNEVARRVAKRLQALNEKNNTIDNIAEKIMQRLTQ